MKRINLFCFIAIFTNQIIFSQNINDVQRYLKQLDNSIDWRIDEETVRQISELMNNPFKTSRSLERFVKHEKDIESALVKYKVPKVFKYVVFALSECNHLHRDNFGGSGYFMMRYNLAVNQGLHISSYVDERRDVAKAAQVFGNLMSKYHAKYHSWSIALAVYHATELEWEKATILAGSDSFHIAHAFLPQDFKLLIPKFNASVYTFSNQSQFKITPTNEIPLKVEKIQISKMISLVEVARKLEMSLDLLKELNPTFKKDIIPKSNQEYYLILPEKDAKKFKELGETNFEATKSMSNISRPQVKISVDTALNQPLEITSQDTGYVILDGILVRKSEVDKMVTKITPTPAEGKPLPKVVQPTIVEISYIVKKGDFLIALSDYFDCSIQDIKDWNKLQSNQINIDQILIFKVPSEKKQFYASINKMTPEQKAKLRKKK
jgi:membrane-bound lytic murein transglycosylase D